MLYQVLVKEHPEGVEGLHRELGEDKRYLYPSHEKLAYLNLHRDVEKKCLE